MKIILTKPRERRKKLGKELKKPLVGCSAMSDSFKQLVEYLFLMAWLVTMCDGSSEERGCPLSLIITSL